MEPEHNKQKLQQFTADHVSPLYQCSTDQAKSLCFYNIAEKLFSPNIYDVGGTYTDGQPHLWFYYTTSECHGFNYLLNLFVLPRKPGSFSLFLPKTHRITHHVKTHGVNLALLVGMQLSQFTIRAAHKDEHVFVKTFQFDKSDVAYLENCSLLMPFAIQVHAKLQLDLNTVKAIKLQHDVSDIMAQKDGQDFTLVSNTGTKYPVHKLVLAAHSPILKSYLNSPSEDQALDISDEAMNIILEFLYTGTLKNLSELDCIMLLDIAKTFEFQQLFALAQQILGEDITIDNAIDIAVLAKKYNLEKLTNIVFAFIKDYPDVISTESWDNLNDVDLVKQLLKYIHSPSKDD